MSGEADRVLAARAALDAARAQRAQPERAPVRHDLFSSLDPEPEAERGWESPRSPSDDWTEQAVAALHDLVRAREVFTVDDLLERAGTTYDTRSIGAILRIGQRRKWMVADAWVDGGAERHGRPIRLWRSMLWRPPS